MPYLNLDLDYFNHPKTVRLVGLLGKEAEVLPLRLWCYCGKYHCVDGKLSGYSPQEVESAVGWWGKPGEMVTAMVKVGFLEAEVDGFLVHEWVDHSGHLRVFKERAKAGAKARWEQISNASSNAKSGVKQCPIPALPTKPTIQNQTKDISLGPQEATRQETVFLTFPTVGKAKEWVLTHQFLDKIKPLFPKVDVEQESRNALGWCIGHASRRKTPGGMPKFLTGWMTRAQDSGKAGNAPKESQEEKKLRLEKSQALFTGENQ